MMVMMMVMAMMKRNPVEGWCPLPCVPSLVWSQVLPSGPKEQEWELFLPSSWGLQGLAGAHKHLRCCGLAEQLGMELGAPGALAGYGSHPEEGGMI